MTFWQQRRIPINKGWGPCKRTHWVPVNEHYSVQGLDGMTRTWDWRVGIEPGAFAPTGGFYTSGNMGYGGFLERGPGGPLVVVRDRDRGHGLSNRAINGLLDDILARDPDDDRRAASERREDEFRARWLALHNEGNACRDRFGGHIETYESRTTQPINDSRLTSLRAEAATYADRGKQRAEEQARRDRERLWELRDADLGREAREDLEDYGFVRVAPVRRPRW
ncbi:hypothetical protein G647_01867 [Cladophialophora carrionii CBS 160.54]|uniref:Uncharacterized protein n=1 Tax=Cladophialophora carrionii CBS 160.54 TaxID=1279043 RepID=V9DRB1_9EURO|nr:uncharacterized protein G647_01867 [Cladophialophora carrionii CBS 160.54]ETI29414.1 hypothetical protein G647_01867 [Cladophialophora carrionii CBS 160.54]